MRFDGVIFDLDDTLYDEFTYVKQGYACVAQIIATTCQVKQEEVFHEMLKFYQEHGRVKLFDHALSLFDTKHRIKVNDLLKAYRAHKPELVLYPDALVVLQELFNARVRIGVITDGCKEVQANKYEALRLDQWVNAVIFTDDLGEGHAKPSLKSFTQMCERLRVEPSKACYVADNPAKDFLGPNQMGMTSIRLLRGMHAQAQAMDKNYAPQYSIKKLNELMVLK